MGFTSLPCRGYSASKDNGVTPFYKSDTGVNGTIAYSSAVGNVRQQYVIKNPHNATQCTWWVAERAKDTNIVNITTYTSAVKWQYFTGITKDWRVTSESNYAGVYGIKKGDILVFGKGSRTGLDGHVVFVEDVVNDAIIVSEAANSDNHPWWLAVHYFSLSYWVDQRKGRYISGELSHWFWSDEILACILKTGGENSGSGGDIDIDYDPGEKPSDDDPPPGADPNGHWEPVYEEVTEMFDTGETYLDNNEPSTRYLCSQSSRAGNSGTQDAPKAPKWWAQPETRHDFRWDPLYCYTEERKLIYDASGNATWSDWYDVSSNSNTVTWINPDYSKPYPWDYGEWDIDGWQLSGWEDF